MVKPEYIFPLLLILLDVGAAVVYAVQKDYKKAVYWLAAAVLNVTVTQKVRNIAASYLQ